MDQKEAIASLNASLGLGQRKARPSPAAKRREIEDGQVAVLEKVLSEIRRRVRETPAWANGYNSAATVVELELVAVRKGAAPAPTGESLSVPEGWQLVPIIVTDVMEDRAEQCYDDYPPHPGWGVLWSALLAAAPKFAAKESA